MYDQQKHGMISIYFILYATNLKEHFSFKEALIRTYSVFDLFRSFYQVAVRYAFDWPFVVLILLSAQS